MLMKFEIRRHIRTTARALGLNRLFWYVFRLFNDPQISPSLDELSDADVFGHFRDSRGKEHPLIVGLRDRVPRVQSILLSRRRTQSVQSGYSMGHARLSTEDFERYLREIRPSEEQVAKRFYRDNLNRITTTDLRRHATEAGFTRLLILPWIEPRHFDELTADALADTKHSYPSCELTDLISPSVWVLLKKGKPFHR